MLDVGLQHHTKEVAEGRSGPFLLGVSGKARLCLALLLQWMNAMTMPLAFKNPEKCHVNY